MEHVLNVSPYTGYVFPNETVFPWSVMIAVYPYMTGLVAGAFSVSSFYHVFGMQTYKPLARFALLTALSFMIFVPLPLLLHLGHPERAFNAMITPHWTSAFAAFGYFAAFYVCLLVLECFFVFREDNVARAKNATGLGKLFYGAVTLWSDDVSQKARTYDHKWLFVLAVIGVPAAHGLHGYVGFVFGSLKSREWWGSDLMPVIFLFSAVVSGFALLIVLHVVTSKFRKVPINLDCVRGLAGSLWGFLMFGVLLEGVEYANVIYKAREGIELILVFVSGPLFVPYFVLQFGIGAFLPIGILAFLIFGKVGGRTLVVGAVVSALLVLMSVFMMRWNVVIGGQMISKTLKGLLSYTPPLLGRESLLAAVFVMAAPFGLLWVLTQLFPPWDDADKQAMPKAADNEKMPLLAE
ncbi:MAG: polysulfide reductase NrfD [Rhodospirillales bacterium]|nr:polysulfide reductase NrfD [Rhodospirillales bacterium]MDH3792542.1 polysulfide reductase NrfD [Rhodospirillales bacterium]MDH3966282.1 polysulfide reductase NrfD [Rhodospirillales bacterium]